MEIVTTSAKLAQLRGEFSGSVGLVPTMGALHAGHVALFEASKRDNDYTIASIFVNPAQFLEGEDFERYPRKHEADINVAQKAGIDLLFMPSVSEIYPHDDEVLLSAPKKGGYVLEGAFRAGHFSGVLRVVMKLLNLARPARAYFGQKDAQQLLLVRQMVRDLFLPYEIVGIPTVRDPDGLALSSRNLYLTPEQRKEALKISAALNEAMKRIMTGERSSDKIKASARAILEGLSVDYFEVVDYQLRPCSEVKKGESLILVAARVGNVRLIDNLWI